MKGQNEAQRLSATRQAEADRLLEVEKRNREAKERKDQDEVARSEELTRQYDSLSLEVESEVDLFNRLLLNLEETLRVASGEDRRVEWQKVVVEFNQLKGKFVKLSSIDPSKDVTVVSEKFVKDAEELFLAKQQLILP